MEPRPMREIHDIRERLYEDWKGKRFEDIRAELDQLLKTYHLSLIQPNSISKLELTPKH